jgi:transcriptional regulator with XRE-family HTH domain
MEKGKSKALKLTPVKLKVISLGYTQTDLEVLTGIDKRRISEVLNGDRFDPAIQRAIARAVNKDDKWLFGTWHWSRKGRKKKVQLKPRDNGKGTAKPAEGD